MRIITSEELETLISGNIIDNMRSKEWLSVVRMLPCMYPGCRIVHAGTAHHLYNRGLSAICSDYLTMPLCIKHHVFGDGSIRPVQQISDEEFSKIFGMNKADIARRVYIVVVNAIKTKLLI